MWLLGPCLYRVRFCHNSISGTHIVTKTSLVLRPHPQGEKRGTQSLGQGKEFERSNQIAALAQSYDSLTAGMQQCHCLLYKFESPACAHAAMLTNQIRDLL